MQLSSGPAPATNRTVVYLPSVHTPGIDAARMAGMLERALVQDERQERTTLVHDDRLSVLAMLRANSLAHGDPFFGHVVISGNNKITVNEWLRSSGYPLPDWYNEEGNNCESLAKFWGPPTAPYLVLNAWSNSESHANHVFGRTEFFAGQTQIGCGYGSPPHEDIHYWVLLTSHV